MEFRKLEVERRTWGDQELAGSISFSSDKGRINLRLNEGHINKIFEIVADTMIEVAKEAAKELTCNIIEHKDAINKLKDNKE